MAVLVQVFLAGLFAFGLETYRGAHADFGGSSVAAALHPVNALVLFALGVIVARRAMVDAREGRLDARARDAANDARV